MDTFDDAILDSIKIDEQSRPQIPKSQTTRLNNKNRPSKTPASNTSNKNKKAKRLPWNTDVLRDRFTPQPYPVQLVDVCTSFNNLNGYENQKKNVLIFMKSPEWKNYLKLMIIKQYALNLKLGKTLKEHGKDSNLFIVYHISTIYI